MILGSCDCPASQLRNSYRDLEFEIRDREFGIRNLEFEMGATRLAATLA
jgi:hypothetical protein